MSRVLRPFEYIEPKTIEEAAKTLAKYGPEAKVLAGGCDLVPSMMRREIQPKYIIGIKNIAGLDYIKSGAGGLRFGALTTIRSLELSSEIEQDYAVLHEAVRSIKKIQVKTSGTVVGNLCVASSGSDLIPTLLILEAVLRVKGPGSEREIAIKNFCVGGKQCSLLPDEIVKEVFLPKTPLVTGSCFLKLTRTTADIAKVNVAIMVAGTAGICQEARIALGAVATAPVRITRVEQMLKEQKITKTLIKDCAEATAKEIEPLDDVRSTAEYRKETTRILVERALEIAAERMRSSV